MLVWKVVRFAHDPSGSSEGINLQDHAKHDGAKQRPNPSVLKILLELKLSFTSFTTPSAVSLSSSCGWFRVSMQARVLRELGIETRKVMRTGPSLSSDRLSRQRSRQLNAGGLSQRQTWASRFSCAPALRLRPTVKPSLIHAAVDCSRPWRT